MKHTISMSETACAATAFFILATHLYAEEPVTAQVVKASAPATTEIVVTALRTVQGVQSIPYTAYRLNAVDAQERRADRTVPDALKDLPSVLVQKTSYGQGSPFLRGFTGFRTLFLVDGVRLNNSVFRDGPNQYWNTVDAFSIADYDVVMGPASVLYGSDAVGGTVNALPIAPPDFDGGPVWERRLYYRGASAEHSNLARLQLAGRLSEALGFVGGLTLKDFGDLEGGKDVGLQKHTGYQEYDFDARVDYHIGKKSLLTLLHQSVDQDDAWRTHRTIYGITWEGLVAGDDKVHSFDQARDLTLLKFQTDNIGGLIDGVEATVSRHAQREDQYRVKKDDTSEKQGFDVVTWGTTLQLESKTQAGDFIYGTEYYRDSVGSYNSKYKADGSLSSAAIQGPVGDDATYESFGVYVQDTIRLFDGGLDVIPGLRYTSCRADAGKVKDPVTGNQMSVEGDWDSVVGSLRLLHPLTENRRHVLFAGVSQGFRAPNLSDLTRLDIARSSELETTVSDLDPEKFMSYEIGVKFRFDKLIAMLTGYYTAIDSMIMRAPTGRMIDNAVEVTKRNSGDGYIRGVELSGTYAFSGNWSARLAGSLMDGKVDAYPTSAPEKQRDYISRLMPPTAKAALRWQADSSRFWIEGECDSAAKADKLSADDKRDTQRIPPGGTPGYAVFTIRAGARIIQGLDLTVAVENILDADYRIHGSGVNEPGRNFMLAANYAF